MSNETTAVVDSVVGETGEPKSRSQIIREYLLTLKPSERSPTQVAKALKERNWAAITAKARAFAAAVGAAGKP